MKKVLKILIEKQENIEVVIKSGDTEFNFIEETERKNTKNKINS